MEFATPGSLTSSKTASTPIYDQRGITTGHCSRWGMKARYLRGVSAEFARFKAGMDGVLGGDSVFSGDFLTFKAHADGPDGFCRMRGCIL